MRSSIVVAVVLCCSFVARADAPAPTRVLTVATHHDPPFQIKQADGTWSGISIELLRLVATELGATIVVHDTPRSELTTGTLPDADVVATLVLGPKMNDRYELSHAFYSTGLSIAVPEIKKESVLDILARVFSGAFVWVLIGTIVLLGTVGLLMWWIEKRPVPSKTPEQQAMSKALFWAFEPVIGYKASQHQTRAGRVLGTVWGLCGVVLVSGLTATLASQLTAHKLAPSVRGPDDLSGVRVAVIDHTASKRWATDRGLRRTVFDDLDKALTALDRGDVDAVIEDAPNLKYYAQTTHPHIHVLPGTFMNLGYTFGLRPEAPMRREFNRALIKVTRDDAWRTLLANYLGTAE